MGGRNVQRANVQGSNDVGRARRSFQLRLVAGRDHRHDVGREALVNRIWKWKDTYEKRIIAQQKLLGASCDWRRIRFTLDDVCAKAVRRTIRTLGALYPLRGPAIYLFVGYGYLLAVVEIFRDLSGDLRDEIAGLFQESPHAQPARAVVPRGAGGAPPSPREVPRPLPDIGQTERDRVIEALGPSPIDIDEIIRCTGIETRKVHIILLELDLAGRLQRHPRQLVSLIDP